MIWIFCIGEKTSNLIWAYAFIIQLHCKVYWSISITCILKSGRKQVYFDWKSSVVYKTNAFFVIIFTGYTVHSTVFFKNNVQYHTWHVYFYRLIYPHSHSLALEKLFYSCQTQLHILFCFHNTKLSISLEI